ncbi:MAG: hypothetical protein Q7T82_21425 [Armatimonadota bacterium]|nr:hypothetical protein [Armatimonadota bacterium]
MSRLRGRSLITGIVLAILVSIELQGNAATTPVSALPFSLWKTEADRLYPRPQVLLDYEKSLTLYACGNQARALALVREKGTHPFLEYDNYNLLKKINWPNGNGMNQFLSDAAGNRIRMIGSDGAPIPLSRPSIP